MSKLLNNILITGMIVMIISCAKPEDPSPVKMAVGDWNVVETFVNGQKNVANQTIFERFTLERDQSYILVDNNGFISVGEWAATETNLTLTDTDTLAGGGIYDFGIVYQSYEKMQLLQTISSPSAGDIQIRYLMDRDYGDAYNN